MEWFYAPILLLPKKHPTIYRPNEFSLGIREKTNHMRSQRRQQDCKRLMGLFARCLPRGEKHG
jgi:hypothetical protein